MNISERVAANTIPAGSAENALRRNGFTGERLLKLAHKIANDELHRRGASLGNRYEDFVMWLVEIGCVYAPRYNPAQATGTFEQYIAKHMAHRVPDFYRSKSQGFGDRRHGNDNRIHLTDDPTPPDLDIDFGNLADDIRTTRWAQAAAICGLQLGEWIVASLELTADRDLKRAA